MLWGQVGWREWVGLPLLGIPSIKAKIDSGARTSALHAFDIVQFEDQNQKKIKFLIHPFQRSLEKVIICTADVYETRKIKDSGGHVEERYVIKTPVLLGPYQWEIEITLTNRDNMNFRMLLGRTALNKKFLINSGSSYLWKNSPNS